MSMRFGYDRNLLLRWFIIWPNKINSSSYLRLYVFMVCAVFCILAYVFCISFEPLKQPIDVHQILNSRIFCPNQGRQKCGTIRDASLLLSLNSSENQTFRRTPGIAPVKCNQQELVSEILRLPPIKYLSNFKNPCWYESIETPVTDIYSGNGFAKYSSNYEKAFNRLKDTWLNKESNATLRLRCLPYFFLAGQPKCGSTDFYSRIVRHPDILAPPIKESHWWGKNRYGWCLNYTATIPFKDYVDLYDGAAMQIEKVVEKSQANGVTFHSMITGDASVSTLWSNDDWWKNPENCGRLEPRFTNADHVHFVLPQARIIVLLRNPTDRLYSDFLFFRHYSKSQEYFHQEVSSAIDSLNDCILQVGIRACVYNSTIASLGKVRLRLGLYHVYLQDWLALFPREQVLVVRLEDYSEQPSAVIKIVYQFLNLRSLSGKKHKELMDKPLINTRRQSNRSLGVMLPKTRLLLDNFYRPYNIKLAKLLNDDKFLWEETSSE